MHKQPLSTKYAIIEHLRPQENLYVRPIALHAVIVIVVVVVIILIITFTQDIYNYIPETNHVSRVQSIAIVLYLKCVLHVLLFHP
jgi:hypothetical protein